MNRARESHQTRVDKLKLELPHSIAASNKGILVRFMPNAWIQWQLQVIYSLQVALGALALPLSAVSFLASGKAVVLAVSALFWIVDSDGSLGWVPSRNAAAVLSLCGIFKAVLKGPRPYWLNDKIKPLDPTLEASFGFPSGHTTVAISLYGHVAFHYNVPWLHAAVLTFIALVCVSRVLTGAHFIHDVIGGAVIGTASLILSIGLGPVMWHENRGQLTEAAICALLVLLTFGIVAFTNMTPTRHIKFKDVKEPIAGAGFLLGISICHLLHHFKPPSGTFSLTPSRSLSYSLLGMALCDVACKRIPVSKPDGLHSLSALFLVMFTFASMQIINFWLLSFVFSS